MNEFIFNENGVCTNPKLYFESGGYPKYHVKVETAQTANGLWVYGIHYDTGDCGGGHGCCTRNETFYPTEQAAGLSALHDLRFILTKDIKWYKGWGDYYASSLKKAIQALQIVEEELKPKPRQLELDL